MTIQDSGFGIRQDVVPAQAGTQSVGEPTWAPACAGATDA